MTDESKNFNRVIPQLRRSQRRWRGRALGSCILIVVSLAVIYACWRSGDVQWEWYVLGALGVLVNSLRFASEINEYRKAQRQIETMENRNAGGTT